MRNSKNAILIFLFLGIVLIAWEVKRYLSSQEKGKIVLVVPRSAYSISTIIALEKGFFANYGLKIRVEYVETGRIALNHLKQNKADFASLVETNIASLGFDPFDVQVLCNIEKTYRTGLLARIDKGITNIKDLKGKKIGLIVGSGAQIFLDRLLDKHRLSLQNVEIVNLAPSDLVPGIVNGKRVDAVVLWEPYIDKIKSILGEKALVFKDPDIFTGYKNLVGNKQFLQENKEVALKLLKAYIDAELFIKANKAESIKIVARELQIDRKSVEKGWSWYDFHVSLSRDLLDAVIAEAYWIMLNQKEHKGETLPNYAIYFAPEYLKEVYDVRVRW